MGQTDPVNCTLTNGVCSTAYPFDLKLVEASKKITVGLKGKTADLASFTVTPSTPTAITWTDPGAQVAGTAFTVDVQIKDAYGNLTDNTCGTDYTVTEDSAAENSPDGDTPTFVGPVAETSPGLYTSGNITLVKAGTNTLDFNACTLTLDAQTITVTPDPTVATVAVHTTDSDPGYAGGLSELLCTDDASDTDSSVDCAALYAYEYDAHGNNISGTSATCTWAYTTIGSAPDPGSSGSGHSLTV
ncbi:MAG: hypothetical protein GY746_10950, partial [Gammaproteobacteria bacterium]|nr:hypothetical protein [Gammaproteobacteria bacterium]